MFSQLQFVRLRAAEKALKGQRLDEAYRLATAPDLRDHRRAKAIVSALTEKLYERAREHFRADRFTEALMDLDRAETSGEMSDQIAELRSHVRTVMAEDHRYTAARERRIGEARRRIEGGSIAAGRKILERAGKQDRTAADLRGEVDRRADEVGTMLAQARRLMEQGQWAAASERIRRAKAIDAHGAETIAAQADLCTKVLAVARSSLVGGCVVRCADELACLGTLGDDLPAKREVRDTLRLAKDAGRCVEAGDFPQARRHVTALARKLPGAKWVEETMAQLRKIDDIQTALSAGPLGEQVRDGRSGGKAAAPVKPMNPTKPPTTLDDTVALPAIRGAGGGLPQRLLLLVDGGGSYLILSGARASIGRVASAGPADVALFSDIAERHAEIVRFDEDYFVVSARDIEVGGRPTKHQLLNHGDRMVLGRRAKLSFGLPSRRSMTATLDLSDTTKMPNDVRRVLLFHQHAMIGNGRDAHVVCRHAGCPLVLFERRGELWVRAKNNGHVDTEAVRLTFGTPVEIQGVSLVLEPWRINAPGASTV